MSKQLVESILSGNMLEANDMFEAKLAELRERKMYEMKRIYAAEASYSEPTISKLASGKYRLLTPKERENLSVDPSIRPGGAEHPTGVKTKRGVAKKGKAQPQTPADQWKSMRYSQKKKVVQHVRNLVKQYTGADKEPAKEPAKAPESGPPKGFPKSLSATPEKPKSAPGSQSGFPAPLKSEPKKTEKHEPSSGGMKQVLRGMYRKKMASDPVFRAERKQKAALAEDEGAPYRGSAMLFKNLKTIITGRRMDKEGKMTDQRASRAQAVGRAAKIISTSPTAKKVDKALDSPVGKDLRDIGMRNL